MSVYKNFTGCNVTIRDLNTNQFITQTKILEYDKFLHHIILNVPFSVFGKSEHVSLLILHDNEAFEYCGTVMKSSSSSRTDIGLFKGKELSNRSSKRYDTNIIAKLEKFFIDGKNINISTSFIVTITNISKSGLSLKVPINRLKIGDTFRIRLSINNNPIDIACSVVRNIESNDEYTKLGCRFITLL